MYSDTQLPDAVCTDVNATVGATCEAEVFANVVGALSFDNCMVTNIEISRDQIAWNPSVTFTMADLPASPITVYIRVTDSAGNQSICSAKVFLTDETAPMITCPADLTVNTNPGACSGTVPDLTATVMDNCDAFASITQSPLPRS